MLVDYLLQCRQLETNPLHWLSAYSDSMVSPMIYLWEIQQQLVVIDLLVAEQQSLVIVELQVEPLTREYEDINTDERHIKADGTMIPFVQSSGRMLPICLRRIS